MSSFGYKHTIIRKTVDIGKNLLLLANRVADALLKILLLGTYQDKPSLYHLVYYLDEFAFRFNRKTSRSCGFLFYRIIRQTVNIVPIWGQDIRVGVEDKLYPHDLVLVVIKRISLLSFRNLR